MTTDQTAKALQATLLTRAEAAMAVTDTEQELTKLQARLRPAARTRRLRMLAAAAAVAVVGAGIGLGVSLTGGAGSTDRSPTSPPPSSLPTAHRLPSGTVPSGFPIGTFQHPGAYGLTTLTLRRNGTATTQDPRDDIPAEMRLTFAAPDFVSFTLTKPSVSTVSAACSDNDGLYHWTVAHGQLILTAVTDPCGNRRIDLTERSWSLNGR